VTTTVLVHGVGLDHTMWEPLRARLVQPSIVYDLTGLGDAPKPDGPYSLSMYASQLADVCRGEGEPVDVVGFSLGSLIAQRFAVDHPGLVRRLVLVSSVFRRSAAERSAIAARVQEVRDGGYEESIESALRRWFTADFTHHHPDVVERVRVRMRSNDPLPYSHAYAVFAEGDAELADSVRLIGAPTLVVTGECDERSTPEMTRGLAAAIPGAQPHIVAGVKHLLPLERPHELTDLVNEFLNRPEPGR
jgi:(E)-2-((N-methylformamido)methylene)succinate hydrolase